MSEKNTVSWEFTLPIFPLTILFIILKLTGAISWGWVWVLSPLWLGAMSGLVWITAWFGIMAIGVCFTVIIALILGTADATQTSFSRLKRRVQKKK